MIKIYFKNKKSFYEILLEIIKALNCEKRISKNKAIWTKNFTPPNKKDCFISDEK